jgi:hypothetical protein
MIANPLYFGSDFNTPTDVLADHSLQPAQRPEGDVKETRWRFSLMNWGYDPLKDKSP